MMVPNNSWRVSSKLPLCYCSNRYISFFGWCTSKLTSNLLILLHQRFLWDNYLWSCLARFSFGDAPNSFVAETFKQFHEVNKGTYTALMWQVLDQKLPEGVRTISQCKIVNPNSARILSALKIIALIVGLVMYYIYKYS